MQLTWDHGVNYQICILNKFGPYRFQNRIPKRFPFRFESYTAMSIDDVLKNYLKPNGDDKKVVRKRAHSKAYHDMASHYEALGHTRDQTLKAARKFAEQAIQKWEHVVMA